MEVHLGEYEEDEAGDSDGGETLWLWLRLGCWMMVVAMPMVYGQLGHAVSSMLHDGWWDSCACHHIPRSFCSRNYTTYALALTTVNFRCMCAFEDSTLFMCSSC